MPLGFRLTERRLARGKVRTLWGVTPILTLPIKAMSDKRLGFKSRTLVFSTYYISRNFDINLRRLTNLVHKIFPQCVPGYHNLLISWAVIRFDVLHFFHDRGLSPPSTRFGLNLSELEMYRAAGKRVYLYAYGADVRRRATTLALGKWNFCSDCRDPGTFCVCDEKTAGLQMDEVRQRVTAAIALGDMLAYVPDAHHLPYWPIDTQAIKPAMPSRWTGPLRIAHAPNHTHFKGSRYLEAAIDQLREAGHDIEYVKISGVANDEVLRIFRDVDLIADQFIGGAYGYTALEGMACAKPVLSYVRSPELLTTPEECPILNANPDTIGRVLEWILANRDKLPAIGHQGRAYVERWHSIADIAERLGELYLETGDLGPRVEARIRSEQQSIRAHRATIVQAKGWHHPFRVVADEPEGCESTNIPPRRAVSNTKATGAREAERLQSTSASWSSFDRTPWAHPWLTEPNIAAFSAFSQTAIDRLRAGRSKGRTFAFVGNMANINYMRALGLRRHGLDIHLYLHPHDTSLMSQPFWEDFDGDRRDIEPEPELFAKNAPLPRATFRLDVDPDWPQRRAKSDTLFTDDVYVRDHVDFMPFLPLLEQAHRADAALVTQTFAFGPLIGRPYVIAQSGGDMWFDPARNDAIGLLARRALHQAYAVLVSNPITLAHARRYGLNNCLYVPWCIDEERYFPGAAPEIRAEWKARVGGEFFILCSMRLDNMWKGANLLIEAFASFAQETPEARLVLMGWGADQEAARHHVAAHGIEDKVVLTPIVGKARLARYLRAGDVMIEQFVLGYYGASGLEAFASGLPVVMRLEEAQYRALVPFGAPPVCGASTPEEIVAHLRQLYQDPQHRAERGAAMRRWFMQAHASSSLAEDYAAVLEAAANGTRIDWSSSPLSQPLGPGEIEYHTAQLANAPVFPRYEI